MRRREAPAPDLPQHTSFLGLQMLRDLGPGVLPGHRYWQENKIVEEVANLPALAIQRR